MKLKSYKELIVWKKAVELVKEIFNLTKNFPSSELYGLTQQMRRAAVAIPSNIAEGAGRNSAKDLSRFYSIAYGSTLELETQLIISNELKLRPKNEFTTTLSLLEEVSKMLRVMINKLAPRS